MASHWTADWSSGQGDAVPDDDLVIADEDFLDEKPQDALTFRYVESAHRRPQPSEERSQRFSEAEVGCTVDCLINDRLQLGIVCLFAPPQLWHALAQFIQREKTFLIGGEQTVDALADANELSPESLLAPFCWVGFARGCETPFKLALDQPRIFEQAHDFGPNDLVEKVLTDRAIIANGAGKPPPCVGAETSIIVNLAYARTRRCPIESVTALGAAHETLHDAGCDGPPWRVNLVGLEPFLRQRKGLFADDGRNRDADPILSRPLVAGAVTRGDATTHSYWPCDPLARRKRRLAKARLAFVRRIAQHAPDRRALPAATSLAGGDRMFVQEAGDGADAETLNAI